MAHSMDLGEIAPVSREPSLGYMTTRQPPRYTQLPPGTHFAVILDPKNPDTMTRWLLVEVSKTGRTWRFKCDCSVPGCTRTMSMYASYKGVHPQRER